MTQERQLHKCKFCNEWFNTTEDIMTEHRRNCLSIIPIKINITCDIEAFKEAYTRMIAHIMSVSIKSLKI